MPCHQFQLCLFFALVKSRFLSDYYVNSLPQCLYFHVCMTLLTANEFRTAAGNVSWAQIWMQSLSGLSSEVHEYCRANQLTRKPDSMKKRNCQQNFDELRLVYECVFIISIATWIPRLVGSAENFSMKDHGPLLSVNQCVSFCGLMGKQLQSLLHCRVTSGRVDSRKAVPSRATRHTSQLEDLEYYVRCLDQRKQVK